MPAHQDTNDMKALLLLLLALRAPKPQDQQNCQHEWQVLPWFAIR
jgi:hypothetical protein